MKNAEIVELDALLRFKDFLQGIIENIGDPTIVIDTDYHILFANKAIKNTFDGRDPVAEQLNCYQVMHHLDAPCDMECPGTYPCPLKQAIATKKPSRVTHIHHDSLNNEIFMEIIGSPIFDETGKVVQVVESCRNVTELKQTEEKLEELILDLQAALAKIKRLSGLLPICMSCKRIRDVEGNWENIESYIRNHSEAEFTHGLCQECEKRIYGLQKEKA